MKKYLSIVIALMLATMAFAGVYTIGTGTTAQAIIPTYGYYGYSWSKVIYTATELSDAGVPAGQIDALGFNVSTYPSNYTQDPVKVYVRHTIATAIDNTYPDNTQFQEVYDDPFVWNGNGWHLFLFSTPFIWDGVSNIEFLIENHNGVWQSGYPSFYAHSTSPTYLATYKYQDGSFPTTAGTSTYNRPNIQIYTPMVDPPNPTTAVSPADGATYVNEFATLNWNSLMNADGYKLYFGTSNPPSYIGDLGDVTTYSPTMAASTTYYWQVVPYNTYGDATGSPVWSFETSPVGTVLIGNGTTTSRFPLGSYYGYERSAALYTATELGTGNKRIDTLGWYATAEVDKAVPTKIYLKAHSSNTVSADTWANFIAGATPVFEGTDTTIDADDWHLFTLDNTFDLDSGSNLLVLVERNHGGSGGGTGATAPAIHATTMNGAHLTWQADNNPPATNGSVAGNRPDLLLLATSYTITTPPNPAIAVSPADEAIDIDLTATLNWVSGGGAPDGYKLYFGSTNPPAYIGDIGEDLSYSPTMAYETTYYWQVIPYNNNGDATNCPIWSFTTVEDPVAIPEYFVDFGTESGDWPVEYWTQRNGFYPSATGTTAQWFLANWLNGAAGNNAARINIYGTTRNGWLITRPVNIPATDEHQLKFDLALMKWNTQSTPVTPDNQPDDKFMVLMADDALMTTNLTVLREWDNDESDDVFDDIDPAGETVIIPLTGISGIKYFAFYGESTISNGDNALMIDNVTIREAPAGAVFDITPDVTSWDFGPQIINTTQSKTFTVTNSGVADLTFSNVTVNGTYYSAQDAFDTTPLASGASRDFTVDFAPTVVGGPYEGSLVFTFALRDSYTVDLSGECYDPTVYNFPWTENFDSVTAPDVPGGWTILNANDDDKTWTTHEGDAHSSPNSMRIAWHNTNVVDDYAISPPMYLTGGESYQLEFYYRAGSATWHEKMKVVMGNAPTAEAMTTTLIDLGSFNHATYQRAAVYFTPPSTGMYFLGWHGYSDAGQFYIYFDTVTVSEAVDYDLAATDIIGDSFAIAGTQTTHSVKVENKGAQDVDGYTVYLKNAANDAILAQETISTTLAVGATNTVPLQWTPQNAGEMQIYGEVYFADDETAANNTTDPMDVKIYASDLMVESFEGTTFPPEGWMRTTSSTSYWTYSTTALHGSRSMYAYTSTSLDYRISTPILQVGTGSTLDFYVRATNTSQVLQIEQSTDRETWQQIGSDITFAEANVWYPISIPLSELTNGNYYLAFYAPTHTTVGSIYVDLVVSPQAAAVAPGPVTLLTPADEATNVPARPTLTWSAPTTGGLADEYKVYVGTSDTFTQNDLVATVETLNYTLETNLNYNTQYYWTVAASNETGDSTNNPVFSFTIMPDPTITVFPFTEGFEDGYTHNQVVGQPWTQLTGPGFTPKSWTANNTLTDYNRTPRSGDWNAYLQYSGQSALVRPIYLQSGYDYSLEFYARQDGATDTNAWITALLGSQPTLEDLDRVIVTETGLVNGDYQRFFGQFTVLTSGVYYIGIQGWINNSPWYISLDDITITQTLAVTAEPPILNYPVELSDMPKDGFDFTWTPDETGGAAELYILYIWDDEDYQLGDLAWETEATSFNPVLDEDLPMEFEYGKRYNWAVSAYKMGVESDLAESWFSIEADPAITLPFFEGFEGGNTHGQTIGRPWEQITGTQFTSKYWTANNTETTHNRTPRSGDWNAYLGWSGQSALVRPIDLEAGANYFIRFYARQDGAVSTNAYVKALLGSAATLEGLDIEILPQTNIINGDYQEMYAEFNVETSGRYYLGIQGWMNGSPYYISLDDIAIEEIVPYALPATNPNPADEAEDINALPTLSWQNHGTVASFDLYLSTSQQAVSTLNSSARIVTGQTDPINSYTISTALDYSQQYFWCVVPKDGDGVPPTDPIAIWSFTTESDPRILSLPHAQNFDDVTTPNFPRGWTPIKTNTSASLNTSSTYSHTPSNSVYIYSYSTSETLRLVTPEVMVPMNSIKVSFQLRSTGTTNYSLRVGTVDSPDVDGVFTEIATINPTVSAAFEPHTVSFANYTGTDRYIAFQHGLGAAYQSMYLDTILFEELLTTDMAATAISGNLYGFIDEETTFTITVQNAGSQTQNAYTVDLYSTDSNTPLATVNITEPLASFATAQHQLNWTPTALGDVTLYGKVTLTGDQNSANDQTPNHNLKIYPQGILMEDFESGAIPANWTVINADGGAKSWQVSASNPHTGSYSANISYETSSLQNDDWLITPPLQVTSNTTDEISFWMRTYSDTYEDAWEVLISTTDTNPASFTLIDSGDGYQGTYVQKVYNLDSYGDAVIYLAVRYRGFYDWYMYVDDFFGPPIYVPESLDTPEVTLEKVGTSLKLSWDPIADSNHYKVFEADAPEGPWTLAATTTNTFYSITNPADRKFYQVQASTDPIPNASPILNTTPQDSNLLDGRNMRGLRN